MYDDKIKTTKWHSYLPERNTSYGQSLDCFW